MGFSDKQVGQLSRALNEAYIRSREVQGRTLSYIEGWHAIAEANRIFGFDGWDRETVETKCVLSRDTRGSFQAVYLAKVRITVRAEGKLIVREGFGSGEAHGSSVGETHERAVKTAETDATKRALATFGKPFGLALYISPRVPRNEEMFNPLPGTAPIPNDDRRRTQQRVGRNGRYFVPPRTRVGLDPALAAASLNSSGMTSDPPWEPAPASASGETTGSDPAAAGADERCNEAQTASNVSPLLQPPGQTPALQAPAIQPPALQSYSLQPSSVQTSALRSPLQPSSNVEPPALDEQRLMIDWPKRRREPEHLKYVRAQPCLVCSRTPSDAHHLRFAQSRGIGLKVSDEFTVPLCRIHHDQLHQSGKEVDWWAAMDRDIDPLAIARGLWEETQQRLAARASQKRESASISPPSK